MGQKTVRFSDLSGQLIMHDDALARIVVHEHPDLGDGPVEIEALTDEAEAMEQAALRVAVVDLYLRDDIEPRRIVIEADVFDKLATDNPMSELLIAARPARRTSRTPANGPSRGDRLDYATLEHAGKPHGPDAEVGDCPPDGRRAGGSQVFEDGGNQTEIFLARLGSGQ